MSKEEKVVSYSSLASANKVGRKITLNTLWNCTQSITRIRSGIALWFILSILSRYIHIKRRPIYCSKDFAGPISNICYFFQKKRIRRGETTSGQKCFAWKENLKEIKCVSYLIWYSGYLNIIFSFNIHIYNVFYCVLPNTLHNSYTLAITHTLSYVCEFPLPVQQSVFLRMVGR